MARTLRYPHTDCPQHVTQRGVNRCAIFVTPPDYLFFRECLDTACRRYDCELHAFALMPNHVHLLLTPRRAGAISSMMQLVGRRYVPYFNAEYRRSGGLWQGRFKASLVDSSRYLFCCYRYIELNSVRAGLVTHPQRYSWSSYHANALGAEDPLVTPHERYRALGLDDASRQAAYRHLFQLPLDETTMGDIRRATKRSLVLGGSSFRAALTPLPPRPPQPFPAEPPADVAEP